MGNDFIGEPGAAGVTPDDVRDVIKTDYTDAQIQALIDIADRLVNKYLATAPCHTEESLQDVTLYVAAHFLSVRQNTKSSEKIEETQESQRAPGVQLMRFNSSYWGQTAIILDCSGKLARLGTRTVGLMVAGGGGDFQTFDDETAPENK